MEIRISQPTRNTGTDPAFFVSNGYLGGGSTASSLSPVVESVVDSQANDDTYLVGIRFLGKTSQLSRSTGPLTPYSAHHPRGDDIGRVGGCDDPSRARDLGIGWSLLLVYKALCISR